MPKTPIRFTLNGTETGVFVEGGANLLDVLRREAGDLTAKQGCAQGGCGACSVLIDGTLHLSCLTLAETVEGRRVDTAASLENGPDLHPLQKAFVEGFAAQCGFCTPGFVVAVRAFLNENPKATEAQIREGLNGNVCRCGTYSNIVQAAIQVVRGV